MADLTDISDEPTRLANIIGSVFAGQSKNWSTRLSGGEEVELKVGADAQDDCAVFHLDGQQDIVLGSDYVRGAKFMLYELGHLNEYDVGYYLAMANFSDIAAMGANPIALLSVIRYPRTMTDDTFRAVINGINDACDRVGAPNVGGDIGTAERLILSGAAVGVIESGRALLRSGARPGDRLCVTGYTGIAAAAQKYFGVLKPEGASVEDEKERLLLSSWQRPLARIQEGRCLSTSGCVTSCQDTSDGLKATIESISTSSNVGFVVDERAIPVSDLVAAVSALPGAPPTADLIFGDSVDFQLTFTVQPTELERLRQMFRGTGLSFHEIGWATEDPAVLLRRASGAMETLPGSPWRHNI
ncbi:thiamine-phosphate kinase [Sphaerisporangium album]|uniref:Thiamine-monophosphate kinase n=1 Tax=Sphaerisporangium album TaxID=509200 RepID=A0A367FMN3_9ACTN|nr:thiamine-phosphate kinase [Sphaerisporangium album]RCG31531.1 thiamine-phosphate kinase [Sphaerisporangium album]